MCDNGDMNKTEAKKLESNTRVMDLHTGRLYYVQSVEVLKDASGYTAVYVKCERGLSFLPHEIICL